MPAHHDVRAADVNAQTARRGARARPRARPARLRVVPAARTARPAHAAVAGAHRRSRARHADAIRRSGALLVRARRQGRASVPGAAEASTTSRSPCCDAPSTRPGWAHSDKLDGMARLDAFTRAIERGPQPAGRRRRHHRPRARDRRQRSAAARCSTTAARRAGAPHPHTASCRCSRSSRARGVGPPLARDVGGGSHGFASTCRRRRLDASHDPGERVLRPARRRLDAGRRRHRRNQPRHPPRGRRALRFDAAARHRPDPWPLRSRRRPAAAARARGTSPSTCIRSSCRT